MKWIKELRVTHYLKNALIFVPAFFGGGLLDGNNIKMLCIAFASFCMGASAIYLLNDIKDIEKDRKHPIKSKRPLAAGEISIPSAWFACILLVMGSYLLLGMTCNNLTAILVFTLYLAVNFLYSFLGWKNIPLVDVAILVSGFYLRTLMGAIVSQVQMSEWLSLVIITGAAFLGFGKRRNEQNLNGDETRNVLRLYPPNFLDKAMYSCMTMANLFFALWCALEKSSYYLVLFPIVLLICLRYCMDLETKENQGDPMDIILKDKWLLFLGIVAVIMMVIFLYVLR